jgi:hypothetical protein
MAPWGHSSPHGEEAMSPESEALGRELDAARAELLRVHDRARRISERVAQLETALNAARGAEQRRPSPTPRDPLPLAGGSASVLAMTAADKVTLFRSLFRGRDDVFPASLDECEDGAERLRSGLRQRVGAGRLQETAGEMRRVSKPPVHRGG